MPRKRTPAIERFLTHVEVIPNGCWLWTANVNHRGYGLFRNDDQRQVPAHQWSYDHFIGDRTEHQVRHTCDNPPCVNPGHLLQGTHQQNMQDKVDRGRQYRPVGVTHHLTHLDEDDVRHIRSAPSIVSGKMLAELHGVSPAAISEIRNRNTWKHVV